MAAAITPQAWRTRARPRTVEVRRRGRHGLTAAGAIYSTSELRTAMIEELSRSLSPAATPASGSWRVERRDHQRRAGGMAHLQQVDVLQVLGELALRLEVAFQHGLTLGARPHANEPDHVLRGGRDHGRARRCA